MIKWNKVTWYSRSGALLFFLIIMPIVTFYIGIQYEKTVGVLNYTISISPDTFPSITASDTYDHVKTIFLTDGWKPIIPTEYLNMTLPFTKTPIFSKYPEISWCSQAMSSTCTADFQKGNLKEKLHLDGNSGTWIVMGVSSI